MPSRIGGGEDTYILYCGAYKDLNACPVCGALRYKIRRDDPGDVDSEPPGKRVPAKVMWYAPIIPRLKRQIGRASCRERV